MKTNYNHHDLLKSAICTVSHGLSYLTNNGVSTHPVGLIWLGGPVFVGQREYTKLPLPDVMIAPNENKAPADPCADITPRNAELLRLADKYPPPAEWLKADDCDSFFDGE